MSKCTATATAIMLLLAAGCASTSEPQAAVTRLHPCELEGRDTDEDGWSDACEEALADTFAPTFLYAADEPNLPDSVNRFLTRTRLFFFDTVCRSTPPPLGCVTQHGGTACRVDGDLEQLQYYGGVFRFTTPCNETFFTDGHYDATRKRTFYLEDVAPPDRRGSSDPSEWTVYVHAFPREDGGGEIQYWRFHTFNTGYRAGPAELGFHGGDFEGAQVLLNRDLQPTHVRFTHHSDINVVRWDPAKAPGGHVIVVVERGGHANEPYERQNLDAFIRHQTWSGGTVRWTGGNIFGKRAGTEERAGPLVNVGEKYHPTSASFFIRYSGLWGSIGANFSGWWGPGFNEGADDNNAYFEGWCGRDKQMARSIRDRVRTVTTGDRPYADIPECAPTRRLTP